MFLYIYNHDVNLGRRKEDIYKLINFNHKGKHKVGYYPKSLLVFTTYQVQGWWTMILIPVKYQPDDNNVREIILKSSSHTHLKYSKLYTLILQKVKKPPDEFFTNILFASEIILIFGGLFLHRLSRILKFKLKCLRMPKNDFSGQKFRTRRENPNSSKPSWRSRNQPLQGHTNNRPFVFCKISKDRICHILSSRVESSEQVVFDSDGSSFIVDNSTNSHILS